MDRIEAEYFIKGLDKGIFSIDDKCYCAVSPVAAIKRRHPQRFLEDDVKWAAGPARSLFSN